MESLSNRKNQQPGKLSKHNKAIAALAQTPAVKSKNSLMCYLQNTTLVSATANLDVSTSSLNETTGSSIASSQDSLETTASSQSSSSQDQVSVSFATKSYQTLVAEIYWALEAVRSHTSLNSAGGKGG